MDAGVVRASIEAGGTSMNPKFHRGLGALVCLTVLSLAGCEAPGLESAEATPDTTAPTAPYSAEALSHDARVERGRYLVTIGGCNDCHTPFKMGERGPEPDMTRMLSGHPEAFVITQAPRVSDPQWPWAGTATNTAFAGPWGVSFAFNLTPDENTGIGIWTEEIFVRAMRTGQHWGQSRPILPPMPWQSVAAMTDEDISAVFAYLRSIPPIPNRVPEPLPPGQAPAAVPAAGG